MSAEEARELINNKEYHLTKIFKDIKETAGNEGGTAIEYYGGSEKLLSEIKADLDDLGYKTELVYEGIIISWEL